MDEGEFLTPAEVALHLNVNRMTVYRLIKAKQNPLPSIRVGSAIRIPRKALDEWVVKQLPF